MSIGSLTPNTMLIHLKNLGNLEMKKRMPLNRSRPHKCNKMMVKKVRNSRSNLKASPKTKPRRTLTKTLIE